MSSNLDWMKFCDLYRATLISIVQHSDQPAIVKKAQNYLKDINHSMEDAKLFLAIDNFLESVAVSLGEALASERSENEIFPSA